MLKIAVLSFLTLVSTTLMASVPLSGEAPDFTLKSNQNDSALRLQDFRGTVVMLNFWASWCGPCRQEFPLMDALQKKYERLGFTILAVNVDEVQQDADDFLNDFPVAFPIVYDPDSTVSERYDVDAMPTTIMIDRDGNQRYLHRGYQPGFEDAYEAEIKALVRE